MIVLDTNIVSETWRSRPDPHVVAWLDGQSPDSLFLCAPVLAELKYGIERLEDGQRKDRLNEAFDRLEREGFTGRILPFDMLAATAFGKVTAMRERAGRRIGTMDAQIAAIAQTNRMAIATRDTSDFADIGLQIINPFEAVADR